MKIIFDFDGTLADTFELLVEALRKCHHQYGFRYIETEDVEPLRHCSASEIINKLQINWLRLPSVIHFVRQYMASHLHSAQIASDWSRTLPVLYKQHDLSIISSNCDTNIGMFLTYHKLPYFKQVTSGIGLFGKAHAIKKQLQANQWPTSDVIYVGDEIRDIKAAKQCNIRVVAVSWGYNSRAALSAAVPDQLIDSSSELLKFLK